MSDCRTLALSIIKKGGSLGESRSKKRGSMGESELKKGVNVATHPRHQILGSANQGCPIPGEGIKGGVRVWVALKVTF